MTVSLDLTKRAWTRVKGPITLIGTWLLTDGRWRPCMAIIRTGDELSENLWPCVITLDKAWVWSREIGDEVLAGKTLAGFIDPLRLTPDDRTIIGLYWLIHDHLGDLIRIPPYRPEATGPVLAEVTITDRHTGKTREVELHDDV